MTREQAIKIAVDRATEIPMAGPALVAGVIDILASLDLIRFSHERLTLSELTDHKRPSP